MGTPAIDHTYRYAFASKVFDGKKSDELRLATSGGAAEYPYFFQGQLRKPRLTALLLRTLSKVVTARFHIPAAMLRRILAARDPVVTSGEGLLRLEGFSGCCSTYARVDLSPDSYDGVVMGQGTTNVDFNQEMCAALAQIRDDEKVSVAVGTDEVSLLRGQEQIRERKVKLPIRWLKGFVEVQACQSRMERRFDLGKIDTLRFLRSLPRSTTARAAYWILPAGKGLRLSQRQSEEGLRVAGIERLRLLDDLAPFANGLTIFADPRGESSEWRLHFGPLDFHLTLSAEVWRGFSGEGQALSDLAGDGGENLLKLVQGMLKWQAAIRPSEFATNWNTSVEKLRAAFAVLGSRGLVGYDTEREAYFHRELPFDLELVEQMHPRLRNAQKILEAGKIKVLSRTDDMLEAEVPGSDVDHRVRLSEAGDRCTCPWHAKHRGMRGPCKHILAVQILTERNEETIE